jgi:hypothetical protein
MNLAFKLTFLPLLLLACIFAMAQAPKQQLIKGQVTDDASKSFIAGATVSVLDDSSNMTITNQNGRFVLSHVAVGRRSLVVSCLGYQTQIIPEILVTSGREVDLTISLTQRVEALDELIVRGSSKRVLNNKMVAVSGRTFNAEQASRFAGALGDPSRMVAGFAGVISANDSRNDIIVRGNSPGGLLWQLEGIDIPNPNHYGSLSSTGGPVSILNNNNLDKSDFLTGAFPAQYGNALASVFDLRLKNGNADKAEFLAEIGFTGFELGAQGPFSKKKNSSYSVNYRYSTLEILSVTGLDFGTGKAIPKYQDLNFKLLFPAGEKTTLSIFGLGGPSRVQFLGADADKTNLYGAMDRNLFTHYFTGIAGVALESHFSKKTYGKLSLGYSNTREHIEQDSISPLTKLAYRSEEHNYATNRISLNYFLSHKFDRKNSMVVGTNNSLLIDKLYDKRIYGGGTKRKGQPRSKGSFVSATGLCPTETPLFRSILFKCGCSFSNPDPESCCFH